MKVHESTDGHIDSLVNFKLLSKSGIEESVGFGQNKPISGIKLNKINEN